MPLEEIARLVGHDLPVRSVIHTVGPNYSAGQQGRSLLESSYDAPLKFADQLGVRSIMFRLSAAGAYGWPLPDAISAAVETIAGADIAVEDVQIVILDRETCERVDSELAPINAAADPPRRP